ncbi:hypothetical protein GSI_02964 [Ganoderma sinense ZZ0214-1]|uniref:Uncharacterized protein n=1 Tax=Ganoderma sinense ZZ0214-1 TaxID=1077348 RepID=A0A2G8SN30_9APHY|nr:hypothetical protein GSI_02964 [Ganoderma sinense ZZ0214-1]
MSIDSETAEIISEEYLLGKFNEYETSTLPTTATQLLLFVSPAMFSALRVYALTGQNKVIALITLFFSLGPIYANAIHYGWEKPGHYGSELDCLVLDSATHQMGIM